MCGICGAIGSETHLAERSVRKMMDALIHRGPDGEGILVRPRAVLGVRRLGIIDLAGGHQPIFNEAGDAAVVFNGEIYNFRQLRHELERRGHRFRTLSDTEVIVHAYEEWGERCVERLRGMFAFAIWDGRNISETPAKFGRVFLARDRLGIKPLYYSLAAGALFFASEVRALLASGAIERRLSRPAIEGYLLFGSVIEPTTVVEGIYSLPPAHSLTLELGNQVSPKPHRYGDLSAEAGDPREYARTPGSAGSQLRAMLQAAVNDHLFSDVPSGIFLSGGLDSSALAALAAREHGNIQTFTVSFREREFDEGSLARETAEHLGARHHELLLSDQMMQSGLFEAVCALDQPSMDGMNTYFVSLGAHEAGLKMALSGLGGDEVFAGYSLFRTVPALSRICALARYLPRQLRKRAARALVDLGEHRGNAARADRLRKIAAIFSDPAQLPHSYFFARMLFTPSQIDRLLSPLKPSAERQTTVADQPVWMAALDELAQRAESFEGDSVVRYLEMRHYMLNTLLRDSDAMSMHHSLELRVPLLDDRIVGFVRFLPEDSKSHRRSLKPLLAEAVKDLLPDEVLRRAKRPFTLPWQRWLRADLGAELGRRLRTLTPSLESILNEEAVELVWSDFLANRTGWARPWSLFVLNEWVRVHVDNAESRVETDRHSAASVAAN